MTIQSNTKTKTSMIVSKPQEFVKQAVITYLPNDFDGMLTKTKMPRTNYSLSVKQIMFESSKLNSYPAQHVPFITDCDYFGSFMPLWRLLSYTKG